MSTALSLSSHPSPGVQPKGGDRQIRTTLSGMGKWWSLRPGQRSFGHHVRRVPGRPMVLVSPTQQTVYVVGQSKSDVLKATGVLKRSRK